MGPVTRQPSRRKLRLMVSGVTKISVGLGWKWFCDERKNPNPFSEISKYPEPISGGGIWRGGCTLCSYLFLSVLLKGLETARKLLNLEFLGNCCAEE